MYFLFNAVTFLLANPLKVILTGNVVILTALFAFLWRWQGRSTIQTPSSPQPWLRRNTTSLLSRSAESSQSSLGRRFTSLLSSLSDAPLSDHAQIGFSDFLTGWFDVTWPKVAAAASRIMEEKMEAALAEALGRYPRLRGELSYDLKFGDVAPKILEVYSFRKLRAVQDEGAMVCGHMRWDAELDMVLKVGPVRIGVDGMTLEGTGCVIAKPLLPQDPVLGGVQIYFCNPPELKLNYTGMGKALSSWSTIDIMMDKLMLEAFSSILVLPNRMVSRFANTKIEDYPVFRNPLPDGVLRVQVVSASNLVGNNSFTWSGYRTSDPYCIVELGKKTFRSRTISKNVNPVWNTLDDTVDFLTYNENQVLNLNVYNENRLIGDKFLGCLEEAFSVQSLLDMQMRAGESSGKINLNLDARDAETPESSRSIRRTICLRLQYFEIAFQTTGSQVHKQAPSLLTIKIYHVAGMPPQQAQGIQVRFSIGDEHYMSKKSKKVHPKDHFGFGIKQSKIMHRLYQDGTSAEVIARAYNLTTDIVEEVVSAENGVLQRFGWDEALHVLVKSPEHVMGELEVNIKDRWYPLHRGARPITALVALERIRSGGDEHGPGGGEPWRVLDYQGGPVTIGISMKLVQAKPTEGKHALAGWESGRVGGVSSKRGAQLMDEFRHRHRFRSRSNLDLLRESDESPCSHTD